MAIIKEDNISATAAILRNGASGIKVLATFGDSVFAKAYGSGTDGSPDTVPGGVTAKSNGVIHQVQAKMGQPFEHNVKWIGSNASGYEIVGHTAGLASWKIQDCLDNIARLTTTNADAVLLLVGTNDIQSGATSITDMKSQYEQLVDNIITAGISVMAFPIMPRNAADGVGTDWATAGDRLRHLQFNDWLRGLERTKPGLIVMDWYPSLVNPTSGDMTTGYTDDGIHFSVTGAIAAADFIIGKLESYYPKFSSFPYFTSVIDLYDATDNPYGNLLTDAIFTGTGGSKDTGITGSSPNNITVDSEDTTNLSAVMSITAAPTDYAQFGGNWMTAVVDCTGSGSGEKFIRYQMPTRSVPSGTTGAWFKAGCFVKITAAAAAGLLYGVYIKAINVGTSNSYYSMRDENLPMPNTEQILALETLVYIVADTDTIKFELYTEMNAAIAATGGTALTLEFGQPYFKPMPIAPLFGDE